MHVVLHVRQNLTTNEGQLENRWSFVNTAILQDIEKASYTVHVRQNFKTKELVTFTFCVLVLIGYIDIKLNKTFDY